MRILILSSEFPPGPGGIGTHAHQLAKYFSVEGHPALVLSPQAYVTDVEREAFNAQQTFDIITFPAKGNSVVKAIFRAKALTKALQDFRPDIVLVSGGRSIWLSAFVIRGKRTPWVVAGHGTEFGATSGFSTRLTRLACKQADAVIAVSEHTRLTMASQGITKPRTKVIHNGADARFFQILPQSEINAFRRKVNSEDQFVLLTVGNVTPRKGQEWVIRALPEIVKRHPQVVYWMAGLPSEQQKLELLAASLGVSANIRFWGRVDQQTLLNLYNACDLFVMTSQQLKNGDFEGFGIAVIEAALCGKASVVTDNSGLAEAVQDGSTGLLVPQGQVEPIARAVINLIESPEKRNSLSTTAHTRALRQQTWDRVGAAYLEFFEEVLSEA